MGNHLWHYQVTGRAVQEVFEHVKRPGDRLSGACFTSGSAGTIGCGDYLKEVYPQMKLAGGRGPPVPHHPGKTASATTASRASATSTSPGSTT